VPADFLVKEIKNVPYIHASRFRPGEKAELLLPGFAEALVLALRFPKPMRWGWGEFRFARPLRWLVCLLGDKVLPLTLAGVTAGRISRGHRVLGEQELTLTTAASYLKELEERGFVIADHERRRELIRAGLLSCAAAVGGVPEDNEALLTEVTHLVEYPTVLAGKVDEKYMSLPEEVITTPMREHQKYFPVRSAAGKLLPSFLTVRNGGTDHLDMVRAGNEKVLRARLEDAAFYYREDAKTPLAELGGALDRVTYHDKLGTVAMRVERLRRLAAAVAEALGLPPSESALIDRVALLAKADLTTRMVYDFPELQGVMGAYYAKLSGEREEVVSAIREHYYPRFSGDALPATHGGIVVSLADKLDAIVSSFAIGLTPTGSQDPYALRRQALGAVAMLLQQKAGLKLADLLEIAYQALVDQGLELEPWEEFAAKLRDFFTQRLRYQLQEEGLRYDVVDAALAGDATDLYAAALRARTLAGVREAEGFTAYLNAYTRCHNLTRGLEAGAAGAGAVGAGAGDTGAGAGAGDAGVAGAGDTAGAGAGDAGAAGAGAAGAGTVGALREELLVEPAEKELVAKLARAAEAVDAGAAEAGAGAGDTETAGAGTVGALREELLVEPAEKELVAKLAHLEVQVEKARAERDFAQAYTLAAELVTPVDQLFDAVMIMAEDQEIRAARLELVRRARQVLEVLGDLSLLAQ
jgi:glycyl-tRNA synthetase beta chain